MAKVNIAVSDCAFAAKIVGKQCLHFKSLTKSVVKHLAAPLMPRISFTHVFPGIIVKRNMTILQNVNSAKSHKNITVNPLPVTFNNQTFFVHWNNPSVTPVSTKAIQENSFILSQNVYNTQTNLEKTHETYLTKIYSNISTNNQTTVQSTHTFKTTKPANNNLHNQIQMNSITFSTKPFQEQKIKTVPQLLIQNQTHKTTNQFLNEKQQNIFSTKNQLSEPKLDLNKATQSEENPFSSPILMEVSKTKAPPAFTQKRHTESDADSYEYALNEHFINSQAQTSMRGKANQADDKALVSENQQKTVTPDVSVLADKVYQLIERKTRIERERRG